MIDKNKTKKLIMDKGRGSCSSAKSLGNHSANVHPKELEWEKELEKLSEEYDDYFTAVALDDVKKLIPKLLTQQRTELLEEILGLEWLKEEKVPERGEVGWLTFKVRNNLRRKIKEEIKKL